MCGEVRGRDDSVFMVVSSMKVVPGTIIQFSHFLSQAAAISSPINVFEAVQRKTTEAT